MANEKRLIDANEALEVLCDNCLFDNIVCPLGGCAQFRHIYDMATVDAVEVVHGRWEKRKAIVFDDEIVGYRCSNCNTTWDAETNYCPNCGAKMDGERKDKE